MNIAANDVWKNSIFLSNFFFIIKFWRKISILYKGATLQLPEKGNKIVSLNLLRIKDLTQFLMIKNKYK